MINQSLRNLLIISFVKPPVYNKIIKLQYVTISDTSIPFIIPVPVIEVSIVGPLYI